MKLPNLKKREKCPSAKTLFKNRKRRKRIQVTIEGQHNLATTVRPISLNQNKVLGKLNSVAGSKLWPSTLYDINTRILQYHV